MCVREMQLLGSSVVFNYSIVFHQGAVTALALRRLLLLNTMLSKSSRKSTEPKPVAIKRTLPENATNLEKEQAETLDAKRYKIQHDVKNVDKAMYDNFRNLSNIQIYIGIRDSSTLFDRSTRDKDLADIFDHGQKILL